MTTTSEQKTSESTGSLLSEAMKHISSLVRGEFDLARAEMDENLRKAITAVGLLAGALVIALVALNVLAAAVVSGLTELGIDAGWSAVIVGVALGIVAAALIAKGTNDLKLSSLAPTRTAENLKRDARAVQGGRTND